MSINGTINYSVTIPPALAKEWLETFAYFGQRKVDQHRVDYYANEMVAGKWLPGGPIELASISGSGHKYLVNGQHRLLAIIESGATCQFTVIEHMAQTQDDITEIYLVIDNNKGRTIMDSLKPSGLEQSTGLTQTDLGNLASGIRVILANFAEVKALRYPLREMPGNLAEWAPAMQVYLAACAIKPADVKSALERRTTVAMGIVTCRYCPDKATPFWNGVSQDDGLKNGDTRKTFRRWLLAHSPKTKMTAGTILSVHAITVYSMLAWNAWFEGREIDILRPYDTKQDIHLLGTPI